MFSFWTSDSARGCDKTTTDQQYTPPDDYFGASHAAYENQHSAAAAAGAAMPLSTRKRSREPESMMPPSPTAAFDPPEQQQRQQLAFPPAKRIKAESETKSDVNNNCAHQVYGGWSLPAFGANTDPHHVESPPSPPLSVSAPSMADAAELERVRDIVQYQFGFEILLKHNELRLIEQELAKCQTALEQLRRCHLIPYPTACPTPEQMLDIASGRGMAVRPRPGATVPKWAAPFGVVDGPYARHYAKWLIPDPVFDGPLPNWPGVSPQVRSRNAATAESRATRNSACDTGKGRPTRGIGGQKLHALSSGYPQPKDKAGPCVLKRSDGKVVKLVCIDCHRENFSSTQGFINHCRIAHKRDFKSHEEAAVHCGHPIEVDGANQNKTPASEAKSAVPSASSSATAAVKPAVTHAAVSATSAATSARSAQAVVAATAALVASNYPANPNTSVATVAGHVSALALSDRGTLDVLLQHVEAAYKHCSQTVAKPTAAAAGSENAMGPLVQQEATPSAPFVGSKATPFLSRFLENNQFSGNLDDHVQDAKVKINLDEGLWIGGADDDFDETPSASAATSPGPATAAQRMPARQVVSSTTKINTTDFAGNVDGACDLGKSSSVSKLSFTTPTMVPSVSLGKTEEHNGDTQMYDVIETDLCANQASSNNAPSLVSDDGEYDDSDDGSSSATSDTDLESVSDVAEINIDDEDQSHEAPRPLRHHRGSTGTSTALKLKKDGEKHVTFVSPVRGTSAGRRK